MEGRRSRSKPSDDIEKADITHVFPPQPRSAGRMAVMHANAVQDAVDDDRFVPMIRGENKRKRAPRGPAGRNLKAKVEIENEDEAKADVIPYMEEEVSVSHSGGFREELQRDQVVHHREYNHGETENGEVLFENLDEGVNSVEQLDKRRGSSRPRVRPSKFRESFPISSTKVKGELKNREDDVRSLQIVLPINAIISPAGKPKEDSLTTSRHPQAVEEAPELISMKVTKKTDNKAKSGALTAPVIPVAPEIPNVAELKAILSVLKRVMKMKEAEPFNKPVDPVELGIPDYFKVVKSPMDLGTIRDRLEKGEVYTKHEGVFQDVALVWSNCRMYNDEGDPIMEFLQSVESTFNKLCLAAGFHFQVTHAAEAKSDQPKGEGNHEHAEEPKVSKKKKAKTVRPDGGGSLKTKIKRSAPVDQVMAESKAREQKVNLGGSNLGDQDRDVKNTEENSGMVGKVLDTAHNEQGVGNQENQSDDLASSQGPVETKPRVIVEEPAPERHHRKGANVQHANLPNKTKRPNGHSTLSHRQGCLCVVCVGRRKREAKLRKSNSGAKLKKPAMPNSEDGEERLMTGDGNADEDIASREDAGDALFGQMSPNNMQMMNSFSGTSSTLVERGPSGQEHSWRSCHVQDHPPSSYQLPLRKLDQCVVDMSRVLLGSKPGSMWNRPRSLGYAPVPFSGKRVGLLEAISYFSKTRNTL